jgi:hypothetical protein
MNSFINGIIVGVILTGSGFIILGKAEKCVKKYLEK